MKYPIPASRVAAVRVTRYGLVTAALLGLLLTTTPAAKGQASPTLKVTPNHGVPGADIRADGSGFGDFPQVTLYRDAVAPANKLADTTIASGAFTVHFAVPNIAAGSHPVIACAHAAGSEACRQQASATLVVDTPPTTRPTTTSTTTRPLGTSPTTGGQGSTTTSPQLSGGPSTTLGGDPPAPTSTFAVGIATTTTSPSFAAPGATLPDISIHYMELTQGVQDFQNRMPLVSKRRTWLRVYPTSDNAPTFEWPLIDGALQLKRGNSTKVIYPENGPIATHSPLDRTNLDHSLNFLIPANYTNTGSTTFKALVWSFSPSAIDNEPNPNNNLKQLTHTFQAGEDPLLYVIPLDPSANPGDEPEVATMSSVPQWMGDSLLDFHPVANPTFFVFQQNLGPGPEAETPGVWDLTARRDEPLIRLAWLHGLWDLPASQRLSGVFKASLPASGYTGWSKSSYFSFWTMKDTTTAAHEVGHQRGLGHVGCKDGDLDGVADEIKGGALDTTHPNSLPKCSLAPISKTGYYGFSTYRSPQVAYSNDPTSPAAAFPMMSYMGPKWSDPYHYCKLLFAYGVPCTTSSIGVPGKNIGGPAADCSPKTQDGIKMDLCLSTGNGSTGMFVPETGDQVLLVSGSLDLQSKTGSIGQVLRLDRKTTTKTKTLATLSDYGIALLDKAGTLIGRVPLDLDGAGHGNDQAAPTDHVGFFQQIPAVGGVATIRLVGPGDAVLAERVASASSPKVSITSPGAAASVGREFDVTWNRSDADGDALLSTVQWSNDNAKTWRPVAVGLPGDSLRVTDAMGLPGGKVRLRVLVSDGVNTGVATTRAITVAGATPHVLVSAPSPSTARYDTARLSANAVDPEDGVLDNVRWHSNLDGYLGRGNTIETRSLSPGEHTVTATATDSDGNVVNGDATFTVIDDGRPAPRVEGDVPAAERLLAQNAAANNDGRALPLGLILVGVGVLVVGIASRVVVRSRRG